jgi:hypothetical protein
MHESTRNISNVYEDFTQGSINRTGLIRRPESTYMGDTTRKFRIVDSYRAISQNQMYTEHAQIEDMSVLT